MTNYAIAHADSFPPRTFLFLFYPINRNIWKSIGGTPQEEAGRGDEVGGPITSSSAVNKN